MSFIFGGRSISVIVLVVLNVTGGWGHLAFLLPKQNPVHSTACKDSQLLLCESLFFPYVISSVRGFFEEEVLEEENTNLPSPSKSPILIHKATELSICLSA